jgi:hypothetical protein
MRTARDNFWLDMPYQAGPALWGEHDADVCVIGGGFTGMASAYFIKEEKVWITNVTNRARRETNYTDEHECRLLSVIPAKAGIHSGTISYPHILTRITTRIHNFESE